MAVQAGSVPISMGSSRSRYLETPSFRATEMWFAARHLLPRHAHAHNGLAVMLEGSFDLGAGGRTIACPPGQVLIEPAGESHTNRMDGAGAHVLALQIDPADADFLAVSGGVLGRTYRFRDAVILACAWRIAGELRRPDALSRLVVEGLGLEMIAEACRRPACDPGRGKPPRWLRRIQELVHDRCLEPLDVGGMAREVGVHPVHVARVFRRHVGMSLGTYARGLRLERAAARLAGSDDPICDIAAECGFADQSHLTRVFRTQTGTTPSRYRRAARDL